VEAIIISQNPNFRFTHFTTVTTIVIVSKPSGQTQGQIVLELSVRKKTSTYLDSLSESIIEK